MTDQTIKHIVGAEPMREGEYPYVYVVGERDAVGEITRISHRLENRGDHAIGWYDVYCGDIRIASMSERAVADIRYETGAADED